MSKSGKKSGTYWMYGRHAVQAALENPERKVRRIWVSGKSLPDWVKTDHQARLEWVDNAQIEKVVGRDAVHQGLAAELEPLKGMHLEEVAALKQPLLVLDQVNDPHNIGAILRSAAAFGVRAMIIPKDHAPGESGVMAKAACGALERVELINVTNLAQAMQTLKKESYWVVGMDGQAHETVAKLAEYRPLALVMGAEGKGLRRLTQESCDLLVRIPISSEMESLNVSNAAAIALYAALS